MQDRCIENYYCYMLKWSHMHEALLFIYIAQMGFYYTHKWLYAFNIYFQLKSTKLWLQICIFEARYYS